MRFLERHRRRNDPPAQPGRRRAGVAAALLLAVAAAACSWPFGSEEAAKTEVVWSQGNQYVRLEPVGRFPGSAPAPNWHPAEFSPRQLRNALQRVGVRRGPEDQPAPLFSLKSLDVLSRHISAGLAAASPAQDVTFAVEQWYPGRPGGNEPKVITGRVFYVGNWLNVIFGSVLRSGLAGTAATSADLHRNPYAPGVRAYGVPQPLELWTAPDSGAYRAPGEANPTWLLFSRNAMATPPPPLSPRKPPERTPAGTQAAPPGSQP